MAKVKFADIRGRLRLTVSLIAVSFMLTTESSLLACPGALFLHELMPMPAGPRNELQLFVYTREPTLQPTVVPIQVNPVTADGRLKFYNDGDWKSNETESTDLLLINGKELGRKRLALDRSFPCKGSVVWEVQDPSSLKYGYLTNCRKKQRHQSSFQLSGSDEPSKLKFEPGKHLLSSPTYRYQFNPENYMQFDQIEFAEPTGWVEAARDSQLLIHADVENFFDMNFDSEDIESKLEVSRLGPVANLARVSFYLKILFFRINLSLSTDVGFFEDSGHIPMMINIPVDASDYLNAGSGVLYSWLPGTYATQSNVEMPILKPEEIRKGWQHLAKIGQGWCHGEQCNFRYTAQVGKRSFSMSFKVKSSLVDRGFFPFFVQDVDGVNEVMDWQAKNSQGTLSKAKRIGMYFEVSGLPEGEYPWDFWLKLGGPVEAEGLCPAPLSFAQVTDLPATRQ